jgi:small subunit ribosomal protein S21
LTGGIIHPVVRRKTGKHHFERQVSALPKVDLRDNESQQGLFRRFRKAVSSSGVMSDLRKKRWFVSKSEERRIAKKKAIRRQRRRTQKGKRRK